MSDLPKFPVKMSATKLLAKVKELKKQYPEAIYCKSDGLDCCKYFSGRVKNGPKTHGCIIGQAIRELYPENIAFLKKLDDDPDCDTSIEDLLPRSKTTDLLQSIQINQDHDVTWGES
jgi:hypothetical protein